MKTTFLLLFLVFCFQPLLAEEIKPGQEPGETTKSADAKAPLQNQPSDKEDLSPATHTDDKAPLLSSTAGVNTFKIRFRMAWSTYTLTDATALSTMIGFDMGASMNIPLSPRFALEVGALSEMDYIIYDDGVRDPQIWYNLKFPVLGKFYYVNQPGFGANAQLGFIVTFPQSWITNIDTNRFDNFLSLVIGAGVDFGKTALDLRLVLGLQRITTGTRKTALEFGLTF